jgi:hypothetical protein
VSIRNATFLVNCIRIGQWHGLLKKVRDLGMPLPLWLLIKGVNVEQWEKRALKSA